jgi:hypothetical protein
MWRARLLDRADIGLIDLGLDPICDRSCAIWNNSGACIDAATVWRSTLRDITTPSTGDRISVRDSSCGPDPAALTQICERIVQMACAIFEFEAWSSELCAFP